MDQQQQFGFLQEKIQQIGSALFYSLSDSVLKLPTSVVSSIKVDEYGFVWFFVEKTSKHLKEFEQEFPVKLDFYKKGAGYFLQVFGKGFVVSDPEEMNTIAFPDIQKQLDQSVALVKVKIQKAEYYETRTAQKTNWWQSALNTINTWLGHGAYKQNNTYFPAS